MNVLKDPYFAEAFEFQIFGALFLANSPRAFLADDTGLGKSLQALMASKMTGSDRLLILCPAIAKVSWPIELSRWRPGLPVVVIDRETRSIPCGPVAVVCNYEATSGTTGRARLGGLLRMTAPFDVAILDEAHYLRTPTAARTKAVYSARLDLKHSLLGAPGALPKFIWALSRDPQKRNAGDLFPHVKALFPEAFVDKFPGGMTYTAWRDRYVNHYDNEYGRKYGTNNAIMLPELKAGLHRYILARRKADVLSELGPIQYVDLPLPIASLDRKLITSFSSGELDRLLLGAFTEGDDLALKVAAMDPEDPANNAAKMRKQLGLAKVPAATEWIEDFLNTNPDRKLIVFAHHRDVISTLSEALTAKGFGHRVVMGGTPPDARAKAVSDFQGSGGPRVFIGQTIAAGTAITLTAASDVLVLEAEYLAADNYQAISRAHRIGQKETVTAWFAMAADTLDTAIMRVARARARDADKLTADFRT